MEAAALTDETAARLNPSDLALELAIAPITVSSSRPFDGRSRLLKV